MISAHLQDAVLKVGDIAYLPRERRFAAMGNRFDWAKRRGRRPKRATTCAGARPCALSGCWAPSCRASISTDKSAVLALLAISFEPAETPEGHVTLHFADGGAIRLHVECIEAELKDLGPVWQAKSKPQHPDDDPAKAGHPRRPEPRPSEPMPQRLNTGDPDFESAFAAFLAAKREASEDVDAAVRAIIAARSQARR